MHSLTDLLTGLPFLVLIGAAIGKVVADERAPKRAPHIWTWL